MKYLTQFILTIILLCSYANAACLITDSTFTTNISDNITLPQNIGRIPTGSVLYKKESLLSTNAGNQLVSQDDCVSTLHNMLSGKIASSEVGSNIYATNIEGVGIRLTLIIDKPGVGHREWLIPFRFNINSFSKEKITTQNIKIRVELIKYRDIKLNNAKIIYMHDVISSADKKIIVNFILNVLANHSYCKVHVLSPQITLPDVYVSVFKATNVTRSFPVYLNMDCENVQRATLTIEGQLNLGSETVFRNLEINTPAKGVGIELLYNHQVIKAMHAVNIPDSELSGNALLPLSVRYAKVNDKVEPGEVKSKITLHFNYL